MGGSRWSRGPPAWKKDAAKPPAKSTARGDDLIHVPDPNRLAVGAGGEAREIVVLSRKGEAPGLFWLGGFRSDMGGTKATAEYETVSRGGTAHAESVEIRVNPLELSYGEILQIYFSVAHDPTQLNRQGPDTGTQYRSNIFHADDSQKRIAEAYLAQLDSTKVFRRAIVTRVERLTAFYPAEAYHQDFLIKNPHHPYIVFNDLPKIANLQRVFPGRYREQPVTAQSSH